MRVTNKSGTLLALMMLFFSGFSQAEFRVVMEPSPPFQFIANNELRGPVALAVRSKFEAANLKASFEVYPWNRAYSLAATEQNVFISNIARTPDRENLFKWIGVVHSFNFALISINELIIAESLDDVRAYTIAVQRNDIAHSYLKKMGFSENENLFVTADITESWRLLNKLKVDFVVEDIDIIELMARDYLTDGKTVTHKLPLPEMRFDTWLAANPSVSDSVIEQLSQLFN